MLGYELVWQSPMMQPVGQTAQPYSSGSARMSDFEIHIIEGWGLPGKEMMMHELAEELLCYVEVLAGSLCWSGSMECHSVLASGTVTAVVDASHLD